MAVDTAAPSSEQRLRFGLLHVLLLMHALAGALFVLHCLSAGTTHLESAPAVFALSPDGSLCAASATGRIWIYRASGELVAEWKIQATDIRFSDDGRRVGIRDFSGVQILELATKRQIGRFLAFRFALSPDGTKVSLLDLEPYRSTRLEIRDLATSQVVTIPDPLQESNHQFFHTDYMRYSSGGKLLAVGGSNYSTFDYEMLLLNAETGKTVGKLTGDKALHELRFSADDRRLAVATAGGGAGRLAIHDVQSAQETESIDDAQEILSALAYDGKRVAFAWENHLELWETDPVRRLFSAESQAEIADVAITPDAKLVVTAERDGALCRRDARDGHVLERQVLGEAADAVWSRQSAPWRRVIFGSAGWLASWIALRIFVGRRRPVSTTKPRFGVWLIAAIVVYEALNQLPILSPLFLISMTNFMLLGAHLVVVITFVTTGISWYLMGIRVNLTTYLVGSALLVGGFYASFWIWSSAVASV